MNIFYQCSTFVSHARAGADNMLALTAAGHALVDDPARADVAILHDEPVYYSEHLKKLAGLDLPVVGYCVVETDPLPPAYLPALRGMDEVWTCSGFSRDILAQELAQVHVVPHVVRRPRVSKADMERMQTVIGPKDGTYTFYTVSDGINPRKNLPALLRAYATLASTGRFRLVVKQYRHALDLSGLPGVVSITEHLTDGEIAALHVLCDCYVSAHCAEAWGLSLSEAMAFGNPVVATGYSGNMEFMNESNSLPVQYAISPIREQDMVRCPPFFTPDMRWAYVDETDLAARMRRAQHWDNACSRTASGVAKAYNPATVGAIMDRRISALAGEKKAGRAV